MPHKNRKKVVQEQQESFGTVAAAEVRKEVNSFSDAKRDELMTNGMALIYGNSGRTKRTANSR